jgi:BirA family transcriptional regulator, biotin operon repressor / biotin---[acetyl-CoA-carboxylase] ligase
MPDGSAKPGVGAHRFLDVRRFDSIDSTNRYLLDEARSGAPEGLVAVADSQEAGRGRLGRTWVAPPGSSLLVSVLLRPGLALPPSSSHLLTVAVALAAADACAELAGVNPSLKWPNDLLVGERKLAGILAEADAGPASAGARAVVVGLGLNVAWPQELPDELQETATALNHAAGSRAVERDELLDRILAGLEARYAPLVGPAETTATAGTAELAEHAEQAGQEQGERVRERARRELASEYRRRCSTVGRAVRVELPDETFTGTAVDISEQGQLMVDVGTCLRAVTAGDVVHLRALS